MISAPIFFSALTLFPLAIVSFDPKLRSDPCFNRA
jgi:hypothetical protein